MVRIPSQAQTDAIKFHTDKVLIWSTPAAMTKARSNELKSETSCITASISTRHHQVCLNFSTRPFDPPRDRISVPRITIPPYVTRRTTTSLSGGKTILPLAPHLLLKISLSTFVRPRANRRGHQSRRVQIFRMECRLQDHSREQPLLVHLSTQCP